MSKAPKKKRRLLRTLAIVVLSLTAFLLLFVAAFVFNPFEGSLPDLRDVVPRGVNFYARKQHLADDFSTFPEPKFWAEFTDSRGWTELSSGSLVQGLRRDGLDRALADAAETLERVRQDSGGWFDLLRDAIGSEVAIAGYEQDYAQSPPRPLPTPWWCAYTRVTWRAKAALGLAGFGFVQGKMRDQGVEASFADGVLTVKTPQMREPIYIKRYLDLVMIANQTLLLEQSQRLIDGSRDEEPLGQMAAYTDGIQQRVERWGENNAEFDPNSLEVLVEPNAFDGFRRFAAAWPNPNHKDSMNERVLASFLNLKGWQQLAGAFLFKPGALSFTGQIGLNSRQHTPFQESFYRAEKQRREEWLDPFLAMVPESACAAAALRMPAGEFLTAMFDALEPAERDLLDDGMRRASFGGTQLTGTRDLIEKLKVAFLSRTGFVFRRNQPDNSKDKNGELMVPVAARSPMPQVAWVFWLRPGSGALVDEFVTMLRTYYATFGFRKVWHLKIPFGGGELPEPVTEFTNPQIPATGEVAMIVFRDFFVVSNSGLLIKDILRTRYEADGARSIRQLTEFRDEVQGELPSELNGLIWLRGQNLLPVFDDYLNFAEATSDLPDPDWMRISRPAAEEQVRRSRYPQYPSKASMPRSMTEPGGEFDNAVTAFLQERWRRERTNFSAADKQQIQQFRAMAQMLKVGYLQLELENNYIRLQGKLLANFR
ncbi:MAG: hypothetical protein H6838_12310 [Planctomycetes bacterium]|nr:hypothetical protein [Planctomycetota bacterium]MCB9886269.1 hypothetical protein [Planctomycetota bacterium]